MVEIFIENIIASATISSGLDLQTIMNALQGSEYNPDQFSGVIYRPEKPKVVVLLFNDGKIMVTAAKSVQDVENAIKTVEKQLKDAGLLKPVGKKPKPEEKVEEVPKEEAEEEAEKETKEEIKEEPEEKAEDKDKEKAEEKPEGEAEEKPEGKAEEKPEGKAEEKDKNKDKTKDKDKEIDNAEKKDEKKEEKKADDKSK